MLCFGCDKVWHSACTGLTADFLKALDAGGVKWLCTGCNDKHLWGSLIDTRGEARYEYIGIEYDHEATIGIG